MDSREAMRELGYYSGVKTSGKMPDYKAVPLAYEEIGIASVQMNAPKPVDPRNPEKARGEKLEDMLNLCEAAVSQSGAWGPKSKLNLVVFPEYVLDNIDVTWTLKDWLNVSIEVPGREIKAIGKKAKELDIYVAFACHIKEPDWPGHYFTASMIIAPTGELIHKHWKAYMKGPGTEYSTTVHDVLDEFIERYGRDAAWPVARTPIGNIATYTCSEGHAPETARAFGLKGAEILCWSIWGGGILNKAGKHIRVFQGNCAANDCYGVYANTGYGGMGGGSMIVDYFGRILTQVDGPLEQIVFERVPIGWFRASREKFYIRNELYSLVLEDNPGRFPPNMYSEYGVPESAAAALRLSGEHARW